MNEPIIVSSWSGHGTPGQLASREIKQAVAVWEAGEPPKTWVLCAWDGTSALIWSARRMISRALTFTPWQ